MEKNYFNGGCFDCEFAERDERGRFVSPCSGYSNCSWEKFGGKVDPFTEEEKDQRIAELEEENEALKEEMPTYEDIIEQANDIARGWENDLRQQVAELQEENAKLKEQLKNSIVPKFKVNDVVYVLDGDILEECFIDKIFILNDGSIYYEIYNFKGTRLSKLFKSDGVGVYTKAEAQKYLEGLK